MYITKKNKKSGIFDKKLKLSLATITFYGFKNDDPRTIVGLGFDEKSKSEMYSLKNFLDDYKKNNKETHKIIMKLSDKETGGCKIIAEAVDFDVLEEHMLAHFTTYTKNMEIQIC